MRWLYQIQTSKQLALFWGIPHLPHFQTEKAAKLIEKVCILRTGHRLWHSSPRSALIVKNRSQLVAMAPSYFWSVRWALPSGNLVRTNSLLLNMAEFVDLEKNMWFSSSLFVKARGAQDCHTSNPAVAKWVAVTVLPFRMRTGSSWLTPVTAVKSLCESWSLPWCDIRISAIWTADHKEFRRMPALFSTLQWKLLEFCEPLRLEHFVIIH